MTADGIRQSQRISDGTKHGVDGPNRHVRRSGIAGFIWLAIHLAKVMRNTAVNPGNRLAIAVFILIADADFALLRSQSFDCATTHEKQGEREQAESADLLSHFISFCLRLCVYQSYSTCIKIIGSTDYTK
ncbi:hypothetical protein SD53_17310 [Rheinheimera mesophila]|nr:hypothetical protein SD53_17310 [Rheinheimera mesophila]